MKGGPSIDLLLLLFGGRVAEMRRPKRCAAELRQRAGCAVHASDDSPPAAAFLTPSAACLTPPCSQEARCLLEQQKQLLFELSAAQRQASGLQAQLERVGAQLEASRSEAVGAAADALAAQNRSQVLQQAMEAAMWREQQP